MSAPTPAPFCRHLGTCGGCDSPHLSYDDQLRRKRALVETALDGLVPASRVAPCIPSPQTGFRGKVHFVFTDDRRGRLALGHYARGSHRPLPIAECPVHDDRGNRLAALLLETLAPSGLRPFPQGPLRHVVCRVSRATSALALTLVVADDRSPRLRATLKRFVERVTHADEGSPRRGDVSVFVNLNDRPGPYLFGPVTTRLCGRARLKERVGGVDFLVGPTSFFQTNADAAETLVALARRSVAEWRQVRASAVAGSRDRDRVRVVDLYAGSGLFAACLAKDGCEVVALEENGDAVADALASQRVNDATAARCRFVEAPAAALVDDGHRMLWDVRRKGVDVLVLDPPRQGCGADLFPRLLRDLTPARSLYVSCEPSALARDLRAALRGTRAVPYSVTAVHPVDMFPHTSHVETVVVLDRTSE
ncbi:MAG: 23S rRNA (uracil(1939)-C(5))-methyltransferase RlmD [Vicinamibacterales bacterium]